MNAQVSETLVLSPALNELIRELHEGAVVVPAGEFQRWALRRLRPLLPASRWAWGVGSPANDVVHAGLGLADPDIRGRAAPLRGMAMRDCLGREAIAQPGRVHVVPAAPPPGGEAEEAGRGERLEYCELDTHSALHVFVVAWRRRGQPPFTAGERALCAALLPHLFVAWRHCRLLALFARLGDGSEARAAAVIDAFGHVHVAGRRFFASVREAWPRWSGARLPVELQALLARGGEDALQGMLWSVDASGCDDDIALFVQPLGASARLTRRERSVAACIVEGESYADAATRLGVSVNTLRNTLVRVYRKLGVGNKLELAQRLGALPARAGAAQV